MHVTGEGRIRESITRRQKAASVASVGSLCDLSLKIPGIFWNFRFLYCHEDVSKVTETPESCITRTQQILALSDIQKVLTFLIFLLVNLS